MTIPQVFGKGKIKMLRGEEPHEGGRKGRKSSPAQLSFSIEEELGIPLKPAAFNVLYVQTPRIGLLQTPVFRALTETWLETGELVRAALRFGFPETSLRSKCPYYDDGLYARPAGQLLASDRLRKVIATLPGGALAHEPGVRMQASRQSMTLQQQLPKPQQQQQQQQQSPLQEQQPKARWAVAPASLPMQQQQQSNYGEASAASAESALGAGEMGFLEAAAREDEHAGQRLYHGGRLIPKSSLLVPELPSGTLVLALNLMAYWAITKPARRGFGGR